MLDTSFKPGDLVRLKGGGPAMTMTGYAEELGCIVAVWWNPQQQEYVELSGAAEAFALVEVKEKQPAVIR